MVPSIFSYRDFKLNKKKNIFFKKQYSGSLFSLVIIFKVKLYKSIYLFGFWQIVSLFLVEATKEKMQKL
jgi:hypothetical protein